MRGRLLWLASCSLLLGAMAAAAIATTAAGSDAPCCTSGNQIHTTYLPLIFGKTGDLATPTATSTPSATATASPTAPATATASATPSATRTSTATASPTQTATRTSTPSRTATPSFTATVTATPSATAGPPVTPRSGRWIGTTSRDHPLAFDVIGGGTQWRTFELTTDWTATACGVTTSGAVSVSVAGPGAITDGQFVSYGLFSFSGRFDSPATATGTYGFSNYPLSYTIPVPPYICNIHLYQMGTWTAELP